MDNEMTVRFALDQAKKRLRAGTIMGEPFRPHAYIPLDISIDKIRETLKQLGYEGELPDIPDDVDEEDLKLTALASLPLDFAAKRKDSLNILGRLLALADIPRVVVVCDTTAPTEGGAEADVLCVASVDLKAPDAMILVPYQKEEDDDVAFGDELVSKAATESLRDDIIEGFLTTESDIYLHEHPEADTDAYVDTLPEQFPNVSGAMNEEA